jgi:SAM-dependent methyltransferase
MAERGSDMRDRARRTLKCILFNMTGNCPGAGYVEGLGHVGGFVRTAESSTGYHGILFELWERFSLGKKCLMIGESKDVKEWFSKKYKGVKFYTVDFNEQAKADFVWDICTPIPKKLRGLRFDSIICQATLEHVADPMQAMRSFFSLLNEGGYVYVHVPSEFPLHRYPVDCLRFYEDWFKVLPNYIKSLELKFLHKEKGHIFACYRRTRETC